MLYTSLCLHANRLHHTVILAGLAEILSNVMGAHDLILFSRNPFLYLLSLLYHPFHIPFNSPPILFIANFETLSKINQAITPLLPKPITRKGIAHSTYPGPIAKRARLAHYMSLERVDAMDPTSLLEAVNERRYQSPEMVEVSIR